MRLTAVLAPCVLVIYCSGCVPIETLSNQDFDSGIYKFSSPGKNPEKVYLDIRGDSLIKYSLKKSDGTEKPDLGTGVGDATNNVVMGSYLYGGKISEVSVDIDLSTVLTKLRPATGGVPLQANTNLNAIIYLGVKKNIYVIKSRTSETKRTSSFIRHWGYDAGIFAGFGNTPVNPTTTADNITQEYDGLVFQKGVAAFIIIEKMAIGIALGYDNLMDNNSKFWIYNNKPWIGLVLAIANF